MISNTEIRFCREGDATAVWLLREFKSTRNRKNSAKIVRHDQREIKVVDLIITPSEYL